MDLLKWRGKSVQIAALVVLAGGLVAVASRQGLGWKLGGKPGTIEAEYKTENAWIVTEIARDITEMSAANALSGSAPLVHVRMSQPGLYSVAADSLSAPVDLDLRDG